MNMTKLFLTGMIVATAFLIWSASTTLPALGTKHATIIEMNISQVSLDGNGGKINVHLVNCGAMYAPACGGECGVKLSTGQTFYGVCVNNPVAGGCMCRTYLTVPPGVTTTPVIP